jgi:putative transposase
MRQTRVVIPDLPHHLYARGNNRRRLFSYPKDYLRFLALLDEARKKTGCLIHALTLMTNHIHLVVTPPDHAKLPRFVHSFAQRYAQYRNRSRDASGKLWEERYDARPILTERQLAITMAYVELNPVRAGMVEHPGEYRWSTYALHANTPSPKRGISRSLWTPSDWYLALGATTEERARAYSTWVEACQARGEEPEAVDEIALAEALSASRYTLRLERPNRSCAREVTTTYRASFAGRAKTASYPNICDPGSCPPLAGISGALRRRGI